MLFMFALGVWGLFSYLRGAGLDGSLSGAFVIGQGLIMIQCLAGVVLYLDGRRPVNAFHYLYGITAIIVLPFVWSYMKDRDARQSLLFYSLLALFIGGLAIRGMVTGG